MRQAVATSSVCGFAIATAGVSGYLVSSIHLEGLPDNHLGYIYLPAFAGITLVSLLTAPLGVSLAHRLPVKVLKSMFAAVMALIGIKMILL